MHTWFYLGWYGLIWLSVSKIWEFFSAIFQRSDFAWGAAKSSSPKSREEALFGGFVRWFHPEFSIENGGLASGKDFPKTWAKVATQVLGKRGQIIGHIMNIHMGYLVNEEWLALCGESASVIGQSTNFLCAMASIASYVPLAEGIHCAPEWS